MKSRTWAISTLLQGGCLAVLIAALSPAALAKDTGPRALLEKAESLQGLGHRHRALEYLEQARTLSESSNDPALRTAVQGALGKAYLLRGRTEEARALLTQALTGAQASGSQTLTAAVLNDLGNLAVSEGKPDEAVELYQRSLRIAQAVGAHRQSANAAANIVRARLQQSRTEAALDRLRELERAIGLIGEPRDRAAVLVTLGELLERLYETSGQRALLERAYAVYSEAWSIGERTRDFRSVALARGGLAQLYYTEGRHEDAGRLVALAMAAAQSANATDMLYRWHWLDARNLLAQGKQAEALAAYRRAVQSFQFVRLDLIQELSAAGASYRDTVGPLFVEFADVLLRRARNGGGQTELVEARDVVEQFRSVELEDYFQDECVARLQARKRAIEDVAADTAVLYPISLKDRTEMLLSIGGRIKQFTIPVGAAALTEEGHELRRKLEKRTTHEYLPHAQRLYSWLFSPLEPELREQRITTIVLIPDGPLRSVPIAAFHDGKAFLVSRFAFAVAPGLTLLEPRPLAGRDARVLLSGLSESVQEYPALPFVSAEMSSIERLMNTKTLRDSDFRAANFEKELRSLPYSVVHIASHGQFDRDPKKSFLLTFDGKIGMDDLEQYMKLTRFRDEPIELLTLSACQTAAGDDRAALGLAGIAIKAGARSALATLWFINDQASSELVSHFYEALKASSSKVNALKLAQQRMLLDAQYRHPSYWAPFLLIGNWL